MIVWRPVDPSYREAVCGLLTQVVELICKNDGPTLSEDLLRDEAEIQARILDLPHPEAADRVVRDARYRIACIVVLPSECINDLLIDRVLEDLAHCPVPVQARVLRRAADALRRSSSPVP